MDRYYGYGIANAYLGDEDQGQMSAWFIMASWDFSKPMEAAAWNRYMKLEVLCLKGLKLIWANSSAAGTTFIIEAKNASRLNKYVQSARLNGKALNDFKFPASELLKGGKLELEMGANPNENWGITD